MGNIEEVNRLLGEALGELTEWRKAWVLDKTHIDASEKYILSVLALLDNIEEENVENYEIAYRQGWRAAKASSLKEPPAEEPTDITLLLDFPEKKSNIVISSEEPEKEGE